MSEIQELEDKIWRLKLAEREKKRVEALKKVEEWRKENKMDVYTSDDYCGMSSGKYSFYYGYEVTMCPKHKSEDTCERLDCDLREWCFTASVDDKEVMRVPVSKLSPTEGEEPFWYLLCGIGQFLSAKEVV